MADTLISTRMAAELLGCTEATVRTWIRNGSLKGYYDEASRTYRVDRWNVTELARHRKRDEEERYQR